MSNMNVADYVAHFLEQNNLKTSFAITGASVIRIIDSIHRHPALSYICPHHEQAGAMAAIGYYRKTGQPGVMLVTAGPGGTNVLTGVASAYLDSIPLLIIAGQEKSEFLGNNLRGKGVQGLSLPAMAQPVTKKTFTLTASSDIRSMLEEALYVATSGRPGPVWIDIPQDHQTRMVDPKSLKAFVRPNVPAPDFNSEVASLVKLIAASKRPLIWAGHGIRLSKSEKVFLQLVETLRIPVLTAWNGADLLFENHPQYMGRAGIYGNRYSNFILQNCDLLLCLGTRLAIPQMGYSAEEFAPYAKKIIVEIDPTEIAKFQFSVDLTVNGCVGSFLNQLVESSELKSLSPSISEWAAYCENVKGQYPIVTSEEKKPLAEKINSYHFIDELSNQLEENDNVVTDMGTSLTCTHAAIRLKKNQRLITSTGLGEMGFGLPCAIGVGIAAKVEGTRTVLIGAEGSLMMNLQEFQTLIHHKLPLKIFILNNNAYLTIFHTENALFGGTSLTACTPETGVSFPDLGKIALAFGLKYKSINNAKELVSTIKDVLHSPDSILCDVFMPQDQFLGPKSAVKVRADGSLFSPPLEDLFPFLNPDEVKNNMIAKKLESK